VDDVTRRGSLRLLAGLMAAAAALSGCAHNQAASESLPSTSASASTPALPPLGPKDLPMPAEARTKDAAGAEAFVRYYIALINRTSKVMDAKPLRDFSQNCRDCNRIAANADKSARSGYRYEGGEITVAEVAPPLVKDATSEMAIRVDQAKLTVLDGSGNQVPEGNSDAFQGLTGSAALSWDPTMRSWLMTYMAFGR
jgi:hypothetical protein